MYVFICEALEALGCITTVLPWVFPKLPWLSGITKNVNEEVCLYRLQFVNCFVWLLVGLLYYGSSELAVCMAVVLFFTYRKAVQPLNEGVSDSNNPAEPQVVVVHVYRHCDKCNKNNGNEKKPATDS